MSDMRRREFITLVGGAAAWPLAARAQQSHRVPRIGVLLLGTPTSFAPRTQAFVEGLRDLGYVRETQIAARRLDLRLHSVPISADTSIEDAFEKIKKEPVQALIVVTDAILYSQRSQILDLVAGNRLPAMYPYREFPEAGGLISYAPSDRDLFRRAASYVDRILKGANPGDLPVEQPTKFELVINLMTAKALGLDVPAKLLALADEVIE
jgi:putative tryptophan/tyrosine transport system substrate-binding protein